MKSANNIKKPSSSVFSKTLLHFGYAIPEGNLSSPHLAGQKQLQSDRKEDGKNTWTVVGDADNQL